MKNSYKPLVISAPEPRSIDLIFTHAQRADLLERYNVLEVDHALVNDLDANTLAEARFIVGQPPLSLNTLRKMSNLKCIFNVESNLLHNMPYDYLFEKGIHVVTTGAVFAVPVAELGLAMALDLARNVLEADAAFEDNSEVWGFDSNHSARLLTGSRIGIVGFGDLGRAITRLLHGFSADIRVYDPWIPDSMLIDQGVLPATLDELLCTSDTVFVVSAVTLDNKHFLNKSAFSKMKRGSSFILLSRADVVNFEDMVSAIASGHIIAASDVFPEEPLSADHPVRSLKGMIRSAHRAGALDCAFKKMGDMVLEDMSLIDQNLPPMLCKRAERETVGRLKSKPIAKN